MKTANEAFEAPRLYTEDETGSTVILKLSRNRNYPERFLTMFEDQMKEISTWDRPPAYHRTLLYLLARLDPIHYRRLSANDIAIATGMSKSSVERALAMMTADKVIFTTGSKSALGRRINRNLVSKSRAERWHEEQEAAPDPKPDDARGR